jgi:hypothetical protein
VTDGRIYPTRMQYAEAVQHPANAFRTVELQEATFTISPQRPVPWPVSGQFAVVFQARVRNEPRALRFFTSPNGEGERYAELAEYVERDPLREHVVASTWTDSAITVGGEWWPMVSMPWVDGSTLDEYVRKLTVSGDSRALRLLARNWRQLVVRMQDNGFAHGDLQHGNVLIQDGPAGPLLRLIDLDGSWIAPFDDMSPPPENGHPDYRLEGRPWGATMDTFPGLVVYTALVGLAHNPSVWGSEWLTEKILFSADDFHTGTASLVWQRLDAIPDPKLRYALGELRACCEDNTRADQPLKELLPFHEMVDANAPSTSRRAAEPTVRLRTLPTADPTTRRTSPNPAQAEPTLPARRGLGPGAVVVAILSGLIGGSGAEALFGTPVLAILLGIVIMICVGLFFAL